MSANPNSSSHSTARAQVLQAAGIVMMAMVLSRLLGLGRDVVINYYYDALSLEANAYAIASRYPQLIFTVIAGGALGSAFIPTFAAYFARDDAEGGWRLFSVIINLATLATTVVAGITFLFTPQIVRLAYPELVRDNAALLPMTADLMRVMLLSPIIFGVSGVVMGALNARQHFLLPALAGSVYNIGIMLGAVLWPGNVMGLGYGVVIGSLGHLLVQMPALRQKQARYTPYLTLRDPGVRQVLRLMAPRVVGLSFSEITIVVTQFLAQVMPLGSIRALDQAWRVMSMPLGFLGQALGIAAFPTFATLAAEANFRDMRRILADTLRLITFLGLPAAVLLGVLRQPLITLFFQRGDFGETATQYVAWALLFYAVGLVSLAAIEVIARAFYALGDTVTPVLAGAAQLLLMIVLGLWFSRTLFPALEWLPFGGLALGHSLSNWVEMGILLWLLRRKMGGVDGRHLWDGVWRMTVAALALGLAAQFTYHISQEAGVLLSLVLGGTAGGLAYLAVSLVLHLREPYLLLRPLRRRA
ncbi:MAG: murein biosynthesis integral membrane protein MurJ [Anaerolineales bacterium]|nr:murein biosynthesis integral membrane protein MurJ [Anaerolineales bacterium]MCB8952310.1 murein biosynthesis integral membrane protein MurJ [Ardenticatenales bacterium]